MSSNDRHADSFSKASLPSASQTTVTPEKAPTKTDNEAAAARAIAERDLRFAGDDGTEAARVKPGLMRIEAAVSRVRASDRPSPFGTSHFPPLPIPKARP